MGKAQGDLIKSLLLILALAIMFSPAYVNYVLWRLGLDLGPYIFLIAAALIAAGLIIIKTVERKSK